MGHLPSGLDVAAAATAALGTQLKCWMSKKEEKEKQLPNLWFLCPCQGPAQLFLLYIALMLLTPQAHSPPLQGRMMLKKATVGSSLPFLVTQINTISKHHCIHCFEKKNSMKIWCFLQMWSPSPSFKTVLHEAPIGPMQTFTFILLFFPAKDFFNKHVCQPMTQN